MKSSVLRSRMPVVAAIVIIALGAIGFARRCSASDESIAAGYVRPGGDTLSVAIEMSPVTYTLHNDTAEGFDYEILRQIAASHGLNLAFHPFNDLEKAFKGLDGGKYDMVVASMPSTNVLKSYFAVTAPVYLDRQVLVQRRSTDSLPAISSQEQLMNDTVWMTEGSPYQTRLRNMARELGDTVYVESLPGYSAEHLAILTALGEIKQAVVAEDIALKLAAQYPQLDVSVPISFNQFQCWALAPGDTVFRDSLDSWLIQFKSTAAYESLARKYLE